MKKNIFVNATAATEGGILTILKQFVSEAINIKNEGLQFYIFTSISMNITDPKIKIVSYIRGKKKVDRIIWDIVGMKRWAKKNNIYPDVIISLQNTGVNFRNVPQIVYIHQPLPYAKESRWNLFKQDERKLWIYKNIFKWWIDLTVKNKAKVIVQTEWMKNALKQRGYIESNIIIAKPNVNIIDIDKVEDSEYTGRYLFYPAADYKYKNHLIILQAVKEIISDKEILDKNFKIIFTLDTKSKIYNKVRREGLDEYFEFIGNIKYEKVLSLYKDCKAVIFPSYIETFGLPLIEGASFGKKILVADCSYSREVLKNYKMVNYIDYDNKLKWKEYILESLLEYDLQPQGNIYINEWSKVFNLVISISERRIK